MDSMISIYKLSTQISDVLHHILQLNNKSKIIRTLLSTLKKFFGLLCKALVFYSNQKKSYVSEDSFMKWIEKLGSIWNDVNDNIITYVYSELKKFTGDIPKLVSEMNSFQFEIGQFKFYNSKEYPLKKYITN